MIDFFTDPNWLDVFIGATALIVSTTLAVYFFLKDRRKKSLSYKILASEPLLTLDEEHSGDIKLLYKGKEASDVHILVVDLVNNGNLPIEETDMSFAPAISFGANTKILSYEITDKDPVDLPSSLRQNDIERGVVLNKLLLNPSDYLTIKFLLQNYDGERIKTSCRIAGIKEIGEIKSRRYPLLTIILSVTLVLLVILSMKLQAYSPFLMLSMILYSLFVGAGIYSNLFDN